MQERIAASLDYEQFNFKPGKGMLAEYFNRIASFERTQTIPEFAHDIGNNGQAFCPAVFKSDQVSNKDFKSQQFFALDFDETLSWENAKARADIYLLPISFAYETFRSVDRNRFRVVFCNDVRIENLQVAEAMQKAILEIFPEADPITERLALPLLGGKNTFYVDPDARINIADLMISLAVFYQDNDTSNNTNRRMKQFAQKTGLQLKNGLPHIERLDGNKCHSNDVNSTTPIRSIYIGVGPITSTDCHKLPSYRVYIDDKQKYNKYGEKIYDTTIVKTKKKLERNFNFKNLYNRCRFWREFVDGERWFDYPKLWGMLTNLSCVEGGRKRFMKAINSEANKDNWSYRTHNWARYVNDAPKYGPKRCENFCPYADTCNHSKNMLTTAKTKRNTIVQLKNDKKYAPLADAENDLINKFKYVQEQDDNNIHIIKGQTGIGKSRIYIEMLEQSDKPYIIAVPTHRLKDEIYDRCIEKGYDVIKTPKLPDDIPFLIWAEIDRLYSIGANTSANKYIRRMAEEEQIPSLIQYMAELDKIRSFKGHIITTHDRFIFLEHTADHNLIVDEDIIHVLLKINKVTVEDLLKIEQKSCVHPFDEDEVQRKLDDTLGANYKQIVNVYPVTNMDYIEEDISDHISSNVMGFLSSCVVYRYNTDADIMSSNRYRDSDIITYVNRHNLPNQKIVIMSATANENIYRAFFGDRVCFYECVQAKYKGKLIQYPARSYSRHCLANDGELMDKAKNIVGDIPIITFKAHKEDDTDLNFGGLEGVNILDGQDMAVIGTPHLNELVYKLYAAALGIDLSDTAMRYQEISYNNFNFYFQTYNNEQLRQIQLWLIESELQQAIGRARLLRNACKVYLFSNFPIEQAEFLYPLPDDRFG